MPCQHYLFWTPPVWLHSLANACCATPRELVEMLPFRNDFSTCAQRQFHGAWAKKKTADLEGPRDKRDLTNMGKQGRNAYPFVNSSSLRANCVMVSCSSTKTDVTSTITLQDQHRPTVLLVFHKKHHQKQAQSDQFSWPSDASWTM